MLNTDIVNCYGSIYTHSISWALHGIKKSKSNISKLFGDKIDAILRWSTYNQTCGIPQGSILMDFIAELILGYADRILHYKIIWYNRQCNNPIGEYKILRFRDDYRIFTHTKEDASRIAKLLTEVLSGLNFKLNQQKTFITDHIIRDAIKPDKYFRIQSKEYDNTMQKQLLLIHSFSERYPNSGSIKTMLQHFFKCLYSDDFISDHSDNDVLIALMLDIMLHNPSSYPIAVPIIGRIIEMKCLNFYNVFSIVKNKLKSVPYTEFLDIWMQRLTIKSKMFEEYSAKICKRVSADYAKHSGIHNMWDSEWLHKDFREIIEKTSIVNDSIIEEMREIPTPEETNVFCKQY